MAYGDAILRSKVTAPLLKAMRERGEPIAFLTAYDEPGARFAEAAGVDGVLVGDSLANVVFGYATTLEIGMPEILHHLRAVRRGVSRAHLVADLPFGSYGVSLPETVANAAELARAGADAVKLEGDFPEEIAAIRRIGVPVMAHIGFTPQSVHAFGKFGLRGKDEAEAQALVDLARRVEDAGAYALVVELVPEDLGTRITEAVAIPTIGIGAGERTSGQVQVMHDVLGYREKPLRHARSQGEAWRWIPEAIEGYVRSVKEAK